MSAPSDPHDAIPISRPFAELFPSWAALSTPAAVARRATSSWTTPIRFDDDRSLRRAIELMEEFIASAFQDDPSGLGSVALAGHRDIQHIRSASAATGPHHREACNFLQLVLGATVMAATIAARLLHDTHDWIVYSIYDESPYPKDHATLAVERLPDAMLSRRPLFRSLAPRVLTRWLASFYYYSFARSAFRELGKSLLPLTEALLLPPASRGQLAGIEAAVVFGNWCVRNGERQAAERVATVLCKVQADTELPASARALATFALFTHLGGFTDRPPSEWARLALRDHRGYLRGHETVQAIVTATAASPTELEAALPDLEQAIAAYRVSTRAEFAGGDPVSRYGEDTLLKVLMPALVSLLGSGRVSKATHLLGLWHDVDPRELDGAPFLAVMHGHPRGVLYAIDGATFAHSPGRDAFTSLVRQTNAFLGTNVTLDDDASLDGFLPDRPGTPDVAQGDEFLSRLKEFYACARVPVGLPGIYLAARLLPIPGLQHPLQTLLLQETGWTAPLSASLKRPKPDRSIRRALLWPGGTFHDGHEVAAVAALLRDAGIAVEVAEGPERTATTFARAYESADYDLFWIIAHGEYDHWSPHAAYLRLSREPELSFPLSGLARLRTPRGDARRLLVLDVCDGGTAATLGGMQRLGIAQILAGPGQAVVSHLWPVQQLSVTTFGALLARALRDGRGFFDAFTAAARDMRRPRDDVAGELQTALPAGAELPRMLRNASIAFDNVHHWGSPAFYQ